MGFAHVDDVSVCQVCGHVAPRGTAHWLDEPHRELRGIRVIRCPEHWSEWALRITRTGRTKKQRQRMAEALKQPKSPFPPYLDPYPYTQRKEF